MSSVGSPCIREKLGSGAKRVRERKEKKGSKMNVYGVAFVMLINNNKGVMAIIWAQENDHQRVNRN